MREDWRGLELWAGLCIGWEMLFHVIRRFSGFALLGAALFGAAQEEPKKAGEEKPGVVRGALREIYAAPVAVGKYIGDLRLTDFFDTRLPGTLKKYNLELSFSPRLGDFTKREFIRYPVELRYATSDKVEVYTRMTPFSPNPFDEGEDHRWGPGSVELGVRREFELPKMFYQKISMGLGWRLPLGNPPVDLIDHYMHLRPVITGVRQLEAYKSTWLITTISYDRAYWGHRREEIPAEVVRRHVIELTHGLVCKPGEWGWFSDYTIRHINEPVGYRLGHQIRGGVIWDMPVAKSRRWGLPGKWLVELGPKLEKEDGYDPDFGVLARVRVKTSVPEVMRTRLPGMPRKD